MMMREINKRDYLYQRLPVIVKTLVNQVVFLVLHYAYDFFPSTFASLFSGINESMFQHMKIGYFAYILTNWAEFQLSKKNGDWQQFIIARIFSTAFFPWVMFLLYFLPEAIFGKVENVVIEILLANAVLLLTSALTILVERHVEQVKPTKPFIWTSITLFLVAGLLFVIYSVRLPWFDVFAIPPGWE